MSGYVLRYKELQRAWRLYLEAAGSLSIMSA